jgi:hypothetical protein
MTNLKAYAPGTFLPIIQHEIVEVVVPADSPLTRIQFPDIQNLRDSNLIGIEFYQGVYKYQDNVPNTVGGADAEIVKYSPTGRDLCPEIVANSAYLTLQAYNGVEFLHQSPLKTHRYVNNFSGNPGSTSEIYQKQFSQQKVNWPKCYIERFDKEIIKFEFSFLFSVYYYKTNEIGSLMGAEFRKQS